MTAESQREVLFGHGRVRVGNSSLRGIPGNVKGGGGGGGKGQGSGGGQGSGHGRGGGKGNAALVSQLHALVALSAGGVPVSRGVVPPPDMPGAITLLSTTTRASSGQLSVTGISQAYNDLIGIAIVRASSAVANDELHIELNGDSTAANYDYCDNFNVGTTPTAQQSAAGNQIAQSIPDTAATANRFAVVQFEICGYTSTSWHKTIVTYWGTAFNDGATGQRTGTAAVVWKNTAAVTSLLLLGLNGVKNLETGSTVRLYGRL